MGNRKRIFVPFAGLAIALAGISTAHACTNFVGRMQVKGNNSATGTVEVVGGEPANHWSEAMTQTVSSGIAKANKARSDTGNFEVWTGPRTDNGWKLDSGTYDVNFFDGGSTLEGYSYTDHYTWNNPAGDCMTWTVNNVNFPQVKKLGTVTINSTGNISGGSGMHFVSYASNWAKFEWPVATAKVSSSPKESGVCISESNSQDGNQAPITVL